MKEVQRDKYGNVALRKLREKIRFLNTQGLGGE